MSELHKFLFEGLPVRGMLVRLTDSWRELLRAPRCRRCLPAPVRSLLGEMAAAATLMQANIKFNGALVLQIFGDGPVKLAVAEVAVPTSRSAPPPRSSARSPDDARSQALLNVHGKGRCAITLDPKDALPGQQPYQGVVPLHGDQREPLQQLSQVLEHYMLQSEQLDTRLVLAANDELAAGLLIQRLPVEGGATDGGAQRGLPAASPSGGDADARRAADARRRHRAAPAVLGRERQPLRAAAAALRLHLLARARAAHAEEPRPRRDRSDRRRAGQGRDRLRVLRPAVPVRSCRCRRAVHAGAQPAARLIDGSVTRRGGARKSHRRSARSVHRHGAAGIARPARRLHCAASPLRHAARLRRRRPNSRPGARERRAQQRIDRLAHVRAVALQAVGAATAGRARSAASGRSGAARLARSAYRTVSPNTRSL